MVAKRYRMKWNRDIWWLFFILSTCINFARSFDAHDTERATYPEESGATRSPAIATTMQSFRHPRWYKRGGHDADDGDDDDNHHDDDDMDHVDSGDTKALSNSKGDYWGGYYDFLINEGSYKFWAVFQLATAALLIYSGFAALYYAKVNPSTTDDYEDYFLRRRRRRRRDIFLGLEPETFQRILDAVSNEFLLQQQLA